jgi:hypothetical protein
LQCYAFSGRQLACTDRLIGFAACVEDHAADLRMGLQEFEDVGARWFEAIRRLVA